jgi:hypothetical protein
MNSPDSCLRRLFEAASRASEPLPLEAPFWMESQILHAWRTEKPQTDVVLWPMPLVRKAFVCACVIIAVSTALTMHSLKETPANELVIVDSAIKLCLMQ